MRAGHVRKETSAQGSVSNTHAATIHNYNGKARSTGIRATIGNATSAAIQLQ